jgi:hypothetical protein
MKKLVAAAALVAVVLGAGRPAVAQEVIGPICVHVSGAYVAALLLFAQPLPFQQLSLNGFRHWGPTLPVYGGAFTVNDGTVIFSLTVGPEPTPPYTPPVFLSGRFDLGPGTGVGQCTPSTPPSPCGAGGLVSYTLADCNDRSYPD